MNRWPVLAEFRSLGVLAVPIIITQLAQMGMGVADAIMAGRVSATELAGIALGGNLYWPLMLLMSGIVMAVTPSVSQLHGAGRIADTGAVVRQALWIGVCGGATGTVTATDLDSMVATNGPSAARQSPGRGTPMEAPDRSRLSPTPSMERIHQRASAM